MKLLKNDGYYYNPQQIVKLEQLRGYTKVYISDGEVLYYYMSIDDFVKMLESERQSDDA